jgi:hypothetical protein
MKTEPTRSTLVPTNRRQRLAAEQEIAVLQYRLRDLEGVWYAELAEIATSDSRNDDGCSPAKRRQLSRLHASIRILKDRLASDHDIAQRFKRRPDEGFSVAADRS